MFYVRISRIFDFFQPIVGDMELLWGGHTLHQSCRTGRLTASIQIYWEFYWCCWLQSFHSSRLAFPQESLFVFNKKSILGRSASKLSFWVKISAGTRANQKCWGWEVIAIFFWNFVWFFLVLAKLRITELHCRNHVERSLFWLEHSTLWWSVLKVFNILGDRESLIFCVHVFMNNNLSGNNSSAFCILPDLICWHNYSHLLFQV